MHAGAFETAVMKEVYPELTNLKQAELEKATKLQGEQIGKWLSGKAEDKNIIPLGYVGAPAAYKQIHSTTERYCREVAKEIMKFSLRAFFISMNNLSLQ